MTNKKNARARRKRLYRCETAFSKDAGALNPEAAASKDEAINGAHPSNDDAVNCSDPEAATSKEDAVNVAGVLHPEPAASKDSESASRTCIICLDRVQSAHEGIKCQRDHFVCGVCLSPHASSFADEELRLREVHGGRLRCPGDTCAAHPHYYPQAELARKLPEDVFNLLSRARDEVRERKIRIELELDVEERVQRGVMEGKLDAARRHITDEILTLKCPRCRQVYFDFDGCAALTCTSCAAGFCAWCGADAGQDAHNHVACCPAKPLGADEFYGTEVQIKVAQKQQKRLLLRKYIGTMPLEVQDKLREEMKDDFEDCGLDTADDDNVEEHQVEDANVEEHQADDEHWVDKPELGMEDEELQIFLQNFVPNEAVHQPVPAMAVAAAAPAMAAAPVPAMALARQEAMSKRMSFQLRYGQRVVNGFRGLDPNTGYAKLAELAAHLGYQENDVIRVAERSHKHGRARFEMVDRAGVTFIRATEKRMAA